MFAWLAAMILGDVLPARLPWDVLSLAAGLVFYALLLRWAVATWRLRRVSPTATLAAWAPPVLAAAALALAVVVTVGRLL